MAMKQCTQTAAASEASGSEPPSEPPGSGAEWLQSSVAMPPVTGRLLSTRRTLRSAFPASRKADNWRRKHFPFATRENWGDWRWQLANRITTGPELSRFLVLGPEELSACSTDGKGLPLAVTPYYLSLLDAHDTQHPLRRCMTPSLAEFASSPGEAADPLGEEGHMPVPGLVHRYPDRVLLLATDYCAAYCRYCTRSRLVGRRRGVPPRRQWQTALDYIAATPAVRDVIVSGGDPLTMQEDALEWLLSGLRRIPHVEVLRIGTKVPAVLPQRITRSLTRMLKKYHPLWMSLHCTHPLELTPEMAQACNRLADAGIPLGSQTVLLKGVNDSLPTLRALYQGLMQLRVRPYYLYQCDPIQGSAHFRTPVARGLEMIQGLRGHISGYAVPSFVVDAPGGGGKIPLLPEYSQGHDSQGNLVLKNYEEKTYLYPDGSCS